MKSFKDNLNLFTIRPIDLSDHTFSFLYPDDIGCTYPCCEDEIDWELEEDRHGTLWVIGGWNGKIRVGDGAFSSSIQRARQEAQRGGVL